MHNNRNKFQRPQQRPHGAPHVSAFQRSLGSVHPAARPQGALHASAAHPHHEATHTKPTHPGTGFGPKKDADKRRGNTFQTKTANTTSNTDQRFANSKA